MGKIFHFVIFMFHVSRKNPYQWNQANRSVEVIDEPRLKESKTILREGWGNPIRGSKMCKYRTRGWDSWVRPSMWWLFFSFMSMNVQNMSKTHTRRDFSRLFGVNVLGMHMWIHSGMGLYHAAGWDNISPDVKICGIINLTPYWGTDKGIPSECPRFAFHDEACRVVDVANLRHDDGIPESLPQCGDWLFFSFFSKMCKMCLKRTLDANFLDCLALTFCDVIGELRPECACLNSGWYSISPDEKIGGYSYLKSEKK